MGHYDWRYDIFTLKETEEEIERTERLVATYQRKREQINRDLRYVTGHTLAVLQKELHDIENSIEKYAKELNEWNAIKNRIESGEKFSWEQAYNIATSRF